MRVFKRMVRKPAKVARAAWVARLWRVQGEPTDFPVVVHRGKLTTCPHGIGLVEGFEFNLERMLEPIGNGALWDRLSALYPVHRTAYMNHCVSCRIDHGIPEYPNLLHEWRP